MVAATGYRGISKGKSAMEHADFDDFFSPPLRFQTSPGLQHDRRRSRSNSRQAVTSTYRRWQSQQTSVS